VTIHVTLRGVLEVIGGAAVVVCAVWLLYALWMLWRWDKR
jgi:hypothetical protein